MTLDDFEPAAREVLAPDVYDYYAGGAGDEWTLGENRRAFDRWVIRPRVLRGVYPPDPSTEILGTHVDFPVLVAPWAYQQLAHPDGELATARAAGAAGTVMMVSSTATDFLEDVAAASDFAKWWQLYVFTDKARSEEQLQRVHDAGYAAVCLTVDFPVAGLRHRDTRSGFMMPIGPPTTEFVFEPNLTWDDLTWIRERAQLPLLLKGILTEEDARLAVEHGADGIVVSNHGGRQLDGVRGALDALPEVVEAVAGRVPVIVDGGVRRGADVLKALALGASAVGVGRPTCWGLAVGGEDGVRSVLDILRTEFENVMTLAGVRSVDEITRSHVAPA